MVVLACFESCFGDSNEVAHFSKEFRCSLILSRLLTQTNVRYQSKSPARLEDGLLQSRSLSYHPLDLGSGSLTKPEGIASPLPLLLGRTHLHFSKSVKQVANLFTGHTLIQASQTGEVRQVVFFRASKRCAIDSEKSGRIRRLKCGCLSYVPSPFLPSSSEQASQAAFTGEEWTPIRSTNRWRTLP